MSVTFGRTIRDIVADDYRTAAVFQRYGLDFCCRGHRTVEEACAESGLGSAVVLRDLEDAVALPCIGCAPRYNDWTAVALIDHIVAKHHTFVRAQLPVIQAHARKVASVHGTRHPEMVQVARLFEDVSAEMTSHLMKEEQILFPYVVRLATAAAAGAAAPRAPFGPVEHPIAMLEAEHESAGNAMAEIRRLTCGYRVPDGACGTYTVLLQELAAFEEDLHQHVHLENNILFPKAQRLEAERHRP
ncbi:MAG TPA: iron-sulfur cluster repair di-iron protein [Vicinamibacterales bacterium]|nr:iron-sulfur cluster repair di-iron protein [Vicinamibacterales bacterium]